MAKSDLIGWFRVRSGYWFAPKLLGYGATPVTWQGWALTLGFAALLIVDVRFVGNVTAKIAIAVALPIVFLPVCAAKTDGGWRWRWRWRWGPER